MKQERLINWIINKKRKDVDFIEELEYTMVDQSRGDILYFLDKYKIPEKYRKKWDGRYLELPSSPFIFLFDNKSKFIGIFDNDRDKFINGKKINPKQIIRLYI